MGKGRVSTDQEEIRAVSWDEAGSGLRSGSSGGDKLKNGSKGYGRSSLRREGGWVVWGLATGEGEE